MRRQTLVKAAPLLLAALFASQVLTAAAGQAVRGAGKTLTATRAAPDIVIDNFQFVPGQDKGLRVKLRNAGSAPAGTSILRLTVRKIDGTPVGRSKDMMVTLLDAGAERWLAIDTQDLIPNPVALADTTFRLDADAAGQVQESDEDNNQVWHNL